MKKITEDDLKIGVTLLWYNNTYRKVFGEYTIVTVSGYADYGYYLDFPDADVPQFMDIDSINRNCAIIEKDKNPEYFL